MVGVDRSSVAIAFPNICFQDSVRDFGVILDQDLSFSLHINQLTRSCYRNRNLEISRAPTKVKSRELVYSQALVQNKIDRQWVRSRESCRQAGRQNYQLLLTRQPAHSLLLLSASPVAGCVSLFVLQRCSRPRSCICYK